jgi:hypothetical protein
MAFPLAILGLSLLLVGFVSILIPLKFLRIRTRKMAVLIFFAGLVLSAIAGTMFGDEQARQAGFDNATDHFEAKNLGLSTPEALAQHRAEQAAAQKAAAAIAERTAVNNAGFSSMEEYKTALAGGFSTKVSFDAHLRSEAFFRIPAKQQAFVDAVERARQNYDAAENDLAKGRTRNARKQAVCGLLKSKTVEGWVGHITNLSSNEDGKGVLKIILSDHATVKTWNNAFSDVVHNTLIDPASPISQTLMSLKEGDRVRFSGTFFQSDVDCIHEASMTLDGSMNQPEYIIRFSSIEIP